MYELQYKSKSSGGMEMSEEKIRSSKRGRARTEGDPSGRVGEDATAASSSSVSSLCFLLGKQKLDERLIIL